MNNSFIALENNEVLEDEKIDRLPWLRNRQGELTKTIEAINRIAVSSDWGILKSEVFEGLVESLEKKLRIESEKEQLNSSEIHRLQGQLIWAKKYSDFNQLAEFFKIELLNIKKQINGK